jgi:predicted amidohydrolase YtcJ
MYRRFAFALLTLSLAVGCAAPKPTADLILTGGKIATMDAETPFVEALAVKAGKILAIGDAATIGALRGEQTRVVELDGRFVSPGFTDAHAHFRGIGRALMNIDLRAARSWQEVVDLIAAASKDRPEGDWILGWGWHQEKWDEPFSPAVEGYPVHDALSAATPNHPVLLKHHAGSHGGIVNARTLELAGINASTPDPEGGKILRFADGRPTGVLREHAYSIAIATHAEAMAAAAPDEQRRQKMMEAELANLACLENGVTTLHDAGVTLDDVELFRSMYKEGRLDVRLWLMLGEPNAVIADRLDEVRTIGDANGRMTVRAIKRYGDGALGTHGAWMLKPYLDNDSSGMATTPVDELEETARLAREHGFQLCVHAIGDRANRETLDIYEEATAGEGDLRWRIEHAQHLDPDDIPRFGQLSVIASMQGIHCTSDAPFVPKRLGDDRAAAGAYVWRSLLDSGATIVNGTDAPIEDISPVQNFRSTVTRRSSNGETFYPEQSMTRLEALASATSEPAFAAFEESIKGKLVPGMLADIVVLSHDLLEAPEAELADAQVEMTIVGGHILYKNE